jgi:hypothetical protein
MRPIASKASLFVTRESKAVNMEMMASTKQEDATL